MNSNRHHPRRTRHAPHVYVAARAPGNTARSPRPSAAEIALAAVDPEVHDAIEAQFIAAGDTAGLTAFGLAVIAVQAESAPTPAPVRPLVRVTPADVARLRANAQPVSTVSIKVAGRWTTRPADRATETPLRLRTGESAKVDGRWIHGPALTDQVLEECAA